MRATRRELLWLDDPLPVPDDTRLAFWGGRRMDAMVGGFGRQGASCVQSRLPTVSRPSRRRPEGFRLRSIGAPDSSGASSILGVGVCGVKVSRVTLATLAIKERPMPTRGSRVIRVPPAGVARMEAIRERAQEAQPLAILVGVPTHAAIVSEALREYCLRLGIPDPVEEPTSC